MSAERPQDRALEWLMRGVTYLIVLAVGYIILDIIIKGAPAISWSFLSEQPRRSGAEGGILLPGAALRQQDGTLMDRVYGGRLIVHYRL